MGGFEAGLQGSEASLLLRVFGSEFPSTCPFEFGEQAGCWVLRVCDLSSGCWAELNLQAIGNKFPPTG